MTELKATPAPGRRQGRPRRPDVEDRVLGAAIALLSERGIDGLTMSEVVELSGVARATVYLRWPNRHALLFAAVRRAMGQPIIEATGDVEADLRAGAERARAIFSSRAFRGVFPALVAGLIAEGEDRISYDTLMPGRRTIGREYDALAGTAGFRTDVLGEVAADLLIGAQLSHYLATGESPTDKQREQSVSVVLDGLRRRSNRST